MRRTHFLKSFPAPLGVARYHTECFHTTTPPVSAPKTRRPMRSIMLLCSSKTGTGRVVSNPRSGACSLLRPLTPPQADGLAVLLQLGDQLVALAHHVLVLLVLVVGPVGLDDALAGDAVNGAGDTAGGDELGEVAITRTVSKSPRKVGKKKKREKKRRTDPKSPP